MRLMDLRTSQPRFLAMKKSIAEVTVFRSDQSVRR